MQWVPKSQTAEDKAIPGEKRANIAYPNATITRETTKSVENNSGHSAGKTTVVEKKAEPKLRTFFGK